MSAYLGWPEDDADRQQDAIHLPKVTCDLLTGDGWDDANLNSWAAARWCADPAQVAVITLNTLEFVLHARMDDLLWQGHV